MPEEQQQMSATEAQPDQQEPDAQEGVDELAGLSDHHRRLLQQAYTARDDARRESARDRQALKRFERENESERQREVREAVEKATADLQAKHDQELAARDRTVVEKDLEARAAAMGYANPRVVPRLVDVDEIRKVDESRRGDVIDKALAKLLETDPYLAAGQQQRQPLITQGGRSEQPNGRSRQRSWLRGDLTAR